MSDAPQPTEKKPWFAPKRYGYGAGLPISWEGWTLMIGMIVFTVIMAGNYRALTASIGVFLYWIVLMGAFLGFAAIAKSRTRGGWRVRKGEE